MEKITETLSHVLIKMEKMEKRMDKLEKKEKKEKKAKKADAESDTEKPKRAINEGIKAWHAFLKNVRALLKENDMGFTTPTEVTQFCSALKAKNSDYEAWSEEEILEERGEWVKPEKSKQELAGKNSRKTTPASSVASAKKAKALPASDDEGLESEAEAEPEPEPEPEVKKKPGRPKKVVEEVKVEKPVEKKAVEKKEEKKAVEKKEAKKPKKKVVEDEDEEYKGEIEAFKYKGVMYAKTDRNDVINEDLCVYMGRWNEETNEIDYKFAMPAYVKKIIAGMKSDDE